MEGGWLVRARWRRRGNWLWPAFVALTVLDGIIGHVLPPSGDGQSLAGAILIAAVLNLLAVLLFTRPGTALVRRVRGDLPKVVARDYVGRALLVAVTTVIVVAGLVHRPAVAGDRRALRDAVARAEAFIGDRAPPEFRRNVDELDTFTIEPGRMYRTCVPCLGGGRHYCVIVDIRAPFPNGVAFAGSESNVDFGRGTG